MTGTARTDTRSASFATSRRGAPCPFEVRRQASLGRGVQTIATILGCCMEDVARVLNPPEGAKDDNLPVAVKRDASPRAGRAPLQWTPEQLANLWLAWGGEISVREACRRNKCSITAVRTWMADR